MDQIGPNKSIILTQSLLLLLVLLIIATSVSSGQTINRLTNARRDDDEPCFSPDGKWIVYQSRDTSGRPDLWIVAAQGGPSQQITHGAGYKCFPCWSPDGKRIIFASDPAAEAVPDTQKLSMGSYDVYAVALEQGQWSLPKQITDTPNVMEYLPSYSPDGKYIAYNAALPTRYTLGDMAIMVMPSGSFIGRMQKPDGKMEGAVRDFKVFGRQLVNSEFGAIEPTWSRDGTTIAFTWSYIWQIEYHHQLTLCLVSVDAQDIPAAKARQLKQLEGYPCYGPAFSPKADLLAFVMSKGQAWDIWVLPAPYTGDPIRLTDAPANDVNPAWSPDGHRIAFASNRKGDYDIYVMNVPSEILMLGGQL